MNVGYLVLDPLGVSIARRISRARRLLVAGDIALLRELRATGAQAVEDAGVLAANCDVLFICAASSRALDDYLDADGFAGLVRQGAVIVDQSAGTQGETKALAARLAVSGVALVDAPFHTESWDGDSAEGAILFGGDEGILERLRPVLEAVCPTIVHCGEVGTGHATRLITTALAACNRLITYECAAVGLKQGLTLTDMARVLNRSSGSSSASERVLPALGSGVRTAQVPLGQAVRELQMTASAAAEHGAPLFITQLARSLFEAAASELGQDAGIDELSRRYEKMAGVCFTGDA